MTGKADFTPEEWQVVLEGPPSAGLIVTRPWGERSFYVNDPSGNGLCFVDETTLFTGR